MLSFSRASTATDPRPTSRHGSRTKTWRAGVPGRAAREAVQGPAMYMQHWCHHRQRHRAAVPIPDYIKYLDHCHLNDIFTIVAFHSPRKVTVAHGPPHFSNFPHVPPLLFTTSNAKLYYITCLINACHYAMKP